MYVLLCVWMFTLSNISFCRRDFISQNAMKMIILKFCDSTQFNNGTGWDKNETWDEKDYIINSECRSEAQIKRKEKGMI